MAKKLDRKSIAATIILGCSILSILLMILTPALFLSYGINGTHALWGWNVLFGLNQELYAGKTAVFTSFNWEAYITILVVFVIGFTTYFIGEKYRGYYIFAAVMFVACAVMFFTMKDSWILPKMNKQSYLGYSDIQLGVGPWAGGFLSCFSAIAAIYEFRAAKLR